MAKALVNGDTITELTPNRPFKDKFGTNHPSNVLSRWTDQELQSIGVYTIQEDPAPEGYRISGTSMTFENGTVKRVNTFAPIQSPVGDDLRRQNRDQALERISQVQHWYMASAPDTFQNWPQMLAYMQSVTAQAIEPSDTQVTWPRFPDPVLKPNVRPKP